MIETQSNISWSEQYRLAAASWVDADAAANLLEETKSAMLARLMIMQGDMPVSRAEMNVKASDEWTKFIDQMNEARKQATLLRVKLNYIQMKFQEWNSENATKRAEMRL
jgi:hypothetical protein